MKHMRCRYVGGKVEGSALRKVSHLEIAVTDLNMKDQNVNNLRHTIRMTCIFVCIFCDLLDCGPRKDIIYLMSWKQ